jgi:DNA-binding MarR family transcriptional regulator
VSSANFKKDSMSEEKRSRQVLVRLTDSEHKELRAEANANGRELAQHIRWLAFLARTLQAKEGTSSLTPAEIEILRDIIEEERDEGKPNDTAAERKSR